MKHYSKAGQQLVAHCFFSHGEINYENYDKYYQQQEEQRIIDRIKMEADY